LFKLYHQYDHNFYRVPRPVDRVLFSSRNIPGLIRRLFQLPRNILLSLARSGIISSSGVRNIYRLLGVRIGELSSIAPQGVYFDVDGLKYISIGKDVHISPNVSIITHTQTPPFHAPRFGRAGLTKLDRWKPKPVKIDDGAVIYTGAIILPGVTVGEGAMVAAGAVVRDDVPPFTIVGGIPARTIGSTRESTPANIQDEIEITHFKFGLPGALCISADFEMNWATRDRFRKTGILTRKFFPGLLEFFERFGIPVTWATVGHLFLENCEKDGERPHPDVIEGEEGWFDVDPCSNLRDAPGWYAPDLIRRVMGSPVRHEIGCHSFSHADLSDERCDSPYAPKSCNYEVAASELKKCVEVMEPFGLVPRSLVFPKNYEGNFEAMVENGLTCFRGRNIEGLLFYPKKDHDLWDIPASNSFSLLLMMRSREDIEYRLRRYVDEAVASNKCAHFFFHPWFMGKKVLRLLEPFFGYLQTLLDKERLWAATMSEIAAYCEARDNTKIHVYREGDGTIITLDHDIDNLRFGHPEITLRIPGDLVDVRKRSISVSPDTAGHSVRERDGDIYLTISTEAEQVTLGPE